MPEGTPPVRNTKKPDPPRPPPPDLFAGRVIHFVPEDFDELAILLLEELVSAMGASVTRQPVEPCLSFSNPASSSRAGSTSFTDLGLRRSSLDDVRADETLPYHYLSVCAQELRLVPPRELEPPVPVFVHPGSATYEIRKGAPLKIWTSANVQKSPNEYRPEDARDAVIDMVVRLGALVVQRRAMADVLVVDKTTAFYAVIQKEIETHGRRGKQKVVERDWVESCVTSGKLLWDGEQKPEVPAAGPAGIVTGSAAVKDSDAVSQADSFEDEGPIDKKGPGRPTGKPRVDYTPEDDDFLCRYLAVYHPEGSWSSRKTYQMLTADEARYPIVSRHSDQSWQERFKKNSGAMAKRVMRYAQLDLDETLKTAAERKKAREVRAQQPQPEAAPPTRPRSPPTAVRSPQQAKRASRSLVQLDDESSEQGSTPLGNSVAEQLLPEPILPEPTVEPPAIAQSSDKQSGTQESEIETQDLIGEYEMAKAAIQANRAGGPSSAVKETIATAVVESSTRVPATQPPPAAVAVPETPRSAAKRAAETSQSPIFIERRGTIKYQLVDVELDSTTADETPMRSRLANRPRSSLIGEMQNSAAKRRHRISTGTTPRRKSMPAAQPDLVPVSTGVRPAEKRRRTNGQDELYDQDELDELPPVLAARARQAAAAALAPARDRGSSPVSDSASDTPPPTAATQRLLTPQEREDSVAQGKAVVLNMKEQYRRKIKEWCDLFKVDVPVLVQAISAIRQKHEGEPLGFDELDAQLRSARRPVERK